MKTFRTILMAGSFLAAVSVSADGTKSSAVHESSSEPLSSQSWTQSSPSYLSSAEIRRVQTALNEETTAAVREDGKMGPQTRAALRQFQVENSLSVTGDPDTATLQALGVTTDAEINRMPASVDEESP